MDLGVVFHNKAINTENDNFDDIVELYPYIDKQWDINNVTIKILTGGHTNKLVGCFAKSKQVNGHKEKPVSAAVVRIYGHHTDTFIDRKGEVIYHVLLAQVGFAAPIYCLFPNGVCYGFMPGNVVSIDQVRNPHISRLIAEKMGSLHAIDFESMLPNDARQSEAIVQRYSKESFMWKKMSLFIDVIERDCQDILSKNAQNFSTVFGSVAKMRQELEQLRDHVEQFYSKMGVEPDIVFCHNDLWIGNILHDDSKDEVHFIDFEYGNYNYAAFDIASHFVKYCGRYFSYNEINFFMYCLLLKLVSVDPIDWGRYPSKEYQLEWINSYLRKRFSVNSTAGNFIPDIEVWYIFVQKLALVSHQAEY